MQYIGKVREVRVKEIGCYDVNNGLHKFLLDRNMIMEYLLDSNYSKANNKYYRKADGIYGQSYDELTEEQKRLVTTLTQPKERIDSSEKFIYNNEEYIRVIDRNAMSEGTVWIFKLLPQIFDNEVFRWKSNKKYKTKEATVTIGVFEFFCIAYANNDVIIDVRYAKCDNRHRNKVTISTIEINDATNEVILEAINNWKENFKNDLSWNATEAIRAC